jgi:hypothetical protein
VFQGVVPASPRLFATVAPMDLLQREQWIDGCACNEPSFRPDRVKLATTSWEEIEIEPRGNGSVT